MTPARWFHYSSDMEPKSVTIKRIPPQVHRRLVERAVRNHRSLNSEIIATLVAAVEPEFSVDEFLARNERFVRRLNFKATPEEIAAFRVAGRR